MDNVDFTFEVHFASEVYEVREEGEEGREGGRSNVKVYAQF